MGIRSPFGLESAVRGCLVKALLMQISVLPQYPWGFSLPPLPSTKNCHQLITANRIKSFLKCSLEDLEPSAILSSQSLSLSLAMSSTSPHCTACTTAKAEAGHLQTHWLLASIPGLCYSSTMDTRAVSAHYFCLLYTRHSSSGIQKLPLP